MDGIIQEILKEYQGIFGTILGIVATTIMNKLIKSIGRVTCYTDNFSIEKPSDNDNSYSNDEILKFFNYEYTFNLQIYNSSEEIRFIRNLKINIYHERNSEAIVTQAQYYDKSKGRGEFEDIKAVNLKPKEIHNIEVIGSFMDLRTKDELYKDINKIILTYTDDKNKNKEIIVKDYKKTS